MESLHLSSMKMKIKMCVLSFTKENFYLQYTYDPFMLQYTLSIERLLSILELICVIERAIVSIS